MADDTEQNPFDAIGPDVAAPSATSVPVVAPSAPRAELTGGADQNPFDAIGPDVAPASTMTGAFIRSAARGTLPAAASLPGMAAGSELGAVIGGGIGTLFGPGPGTAVGAGIGAFVGGLGGGIGTSMAASATQDYALSKLPDTWQEAIGQDDRQRQLDQQFHSTASFLGGIAPYALTMRPGGFTRGALPENATTFQRLMADPVTSRVFGGAVQGGIEAGQEKLHGDVDWSNVAIATGFGIVFNTPTRLGDRLTNLGTRGANAVGIRAPGEAPVTPEVPVTPEAPTTVAQAADAKVMGPGVTEEVFQGAHAQSPETVTTAQDTARIEKSTLNPEPFAPDVHAVARQLEPETFARYDELAQRRDEFKNWIDEYNNPPAEEIAAAQQRVEALQGQLTAHIDAANGYTGGPEARRLRAQVRDAQSDLADIQGRQQAFTEGRAQETPDLQMARQHMLAVDFEMRDLAPQVSAAYRRAADYAGQGIEPPVAEAPAAAAPAAEPVGNQPAAPTTQAPAPAVRPVEEQLAFISKNIEDQLTKAGRPPEEAQAAGALLAARYQARADRFEGALGTPEALFNAEGPTIKAGKGRAKTKEDELAQTTLGKIKLAEGEKPVITLMKDANASTFVHETGHQWLEELGRDAAHPLAPEGLKADAQSVRKWLGAEEGAPLTTRQHEKFARGFEQYMREGVAPSQQLAGVFAKFRNWLLNIYQTMKGLGQPITEDIRSVMDRMLANQPERTVYAPEREGVTTLQALHEADAREVEAPDAGPAADRIRSEKEQYISEQPQEVIDELENAYRAATAAEPTAEAGAGNGGLPEVVNGGGESGAVPAGGAGGAEHGPLIPSRNETGTEGPSVSGGPAGRPERGEGSTVSGPEQRSGIGGENGNQLAPGPSATFGPRESAFIDKAGNIRLDNIKTTEDIKQAMREVADANGGFMDERKVLTDGQVLDLAQSILGRDPDLKESQFIKASVLASNAKAAEKVLADASDTTARAAKKVADGGTDEDVLAYAAARQKQIAIQSYYSGATAEIARAFRALRKTEEFWSPEAKAANATLQAVSKEEQAQGATSRTLFQLRQEAKLAASLDSPAKVAKFLADAQKRSFGKMILEYWMNNLISSISNHATYLVSNTAFSAYKAGPETAVASLVGSTMRALGREGERVHIGEVGAQFAGAVRGLPGAIEASTEAFRSGMQTALPGEAAHINKPFEGATELTHGKTATNDQVTYQELGAHLYGMVRGLRDGILATAELIKAGGVEGAPLIGANYSPLGQIPNIAIRGVSVLPTGTMARLPGRSVGTMDSFSRSVTFSMEKNAIAYRMATEEGLTGMERAARMAEIRQNPTEAMMEAARKEATAAALMSHSGPFLQKLTNWFNTEIPLPILGDTPLLKFINPFMRVAGNILNQSLMVRSPIGLFSPEIRADVLGHNGNIAQDKAIARIAMGTGLAVTFLALKAEGMLTGSGPTDPREKAMWQMAGNQPYSIRIGDMWYQFKKFEPMSMMAGMSADLYDVGLAAKEGDFTKAAAEVHHAFVQNIMDASFMRGPSDLIKAIEDPGRYGESYVRNFAASFVPYSVGLSQVARSIDPYSRQARTTLDAMKSKIPWVSESLYPRRDIWGEPMANREGLAGSAIYMSQVSNDPVTQALFGLGIYPAQVERKIRNVELTDGQYDDFSRIAGRMTKERLNAIVRSPDWNMWPANTKQLVVTEVLKQSREAARGLTMMKYPDIAQQATQLQIAKARGEKPKK